MIEINVEIPQRETIESNVNIIARPIITGVTASVDDSTGTPYVDVTPTGTETEFSFDLAFHNLKGEQGEKGDTGETGQDGVSPIASVEQTASGCTITIIDGSGTTTADLANGQDGTDGFSPIATVTQTLTGATISIEDASGTTTADITNGVDGTDGQDGQSAEITGATASVTNTVGTPSVTVTAGGTSLARSFDFAFTNLKGETGATGANGQDGVSVTGVALQSTTGLAKTYRMSFSNSDYFDYVVMDGAAGSTQWGGISGTLSNQTDLQTELTGLQTQIDALVVSSDVFDVVGTYADLQSYNISTVPVNDIIKVLVDSTHSNAATYYRCVENNNVKSWSYIGAEGAYYTKAETDTLLNGKYDASNPSGYTTNVGTVTSVNNTLPDNNGNVTIQTGVTVDQVFDPTSANAQSGIAIFNKFGSVQTIQDITTLSSGTVTLSSVSSIYKITPASNTTFTFNTSGLSLLSAVAYTFELYIDMSTVYSLTFPSSLTWQGGTAPDLSATGTYFLVFRTIDGGTNWIGNLQGVW